MGKHVKKYDSLKKILEDCVMVPFRFIRSSNSNELIPIQTRFIEVKVTETNITLGYFSAILYYGKYNWTINRLLYELFDMCKKLKHNGVKLYVYESISRHVMVDIEVIENIIYEILNHIRNEDNIQILIFFNITKFFNTGKRRFEEKFYVCCNISESDCTECCFFSKVLPHKMYVVCRETHLFFYDYKKTHKIVQIIYYRDNLLYKLGGSRLYKDLKISIYEKNIRINTVHSYNVDFLKNEIDLAMKVYEKYFIKGSFAPLRSNNTVRFFIDGSEYYRTLYDSFLKAKKEIFIASWWVYPKLFLKREKKNGKFNKSYRLDHVLRKKASEGVKIYILVYQEFYHTLSINSSYTYEIFSQLHRNIKIIRHPNESITNLTYWSHHEKIVVIDQKQSFIGSVDLCLGRFDNKKHSLFDFAGINRSCNKTISKLEIKQNDYDGYIFPGLDYSNVIKKDFTNVQNPEKSCINRDSTPRLPWHDIQCGIVGPAAFDVSLHFIQRWNYLHSEFNVSFYECIIPDETYLHTNRNIMQTYHVDLQLLRSSSFWSLNLPLENTIYEAYKMLISKSKKFIYIENQFFITRNKHQENPTIRNTIGLALIERIEKAHITGEKFKVYILLPFLPAFEASSELHDGKILNTLVEIQTGVIYKDENSFINVLKLKGIDYTKYVIFLSLYTTEIMNGKIKGEQVYVHSKVLIIDGTRMILGSANINDRSMLGDRDTEICSYVEDKEGNEINKLLECLLKEHLCFKKIVRERKKMKIIRKELRHSNINLFTFKNSKKRQRSLEKQLVEIFKSKVDLSLDNTFNLITKLAKQNFNIMRELFSVIQYDIFSDKTNPFRDFDNKITPKSLKTMRLLVGRFIIYPFQYFKENTQEESKLSLNTFIPSEVYL